MVRFSAISTAMKIVTPKTILFLVILYPIANAKNATMSYGKPRQNVAPTVFSNSIHPSVGISIPSYIVIRTSSAGGIRTHIVRVYETRVLPVHYRASLRVVYSDATPECCTNGSYLRLVLTPHHHLFKCCQQGALSMTRFLSSKLSKTEARL